MEILIVELSRRTPLSSTLTGWGVFLESGCRFPSSGYRLSSRVWIRIRLVFPPNAGMTTALGAQGKRCYTSKYIFKYLSVWTQLPRGAPGASKERQQMVGVSRWGRWRVARGSAGSVARSSSNSFGSGEFCEFQSLMNSENDSFKNYTRS